MIRAAIVEDDSQYSRLLERYFLRWCEEKGLRGEARVFPDPVLFLDPYAADYQIVFMDIQMPHINGMDAARRLRELDDTVLLLFVTSMAQYAIQGYAVRAFDYVLKPLSYPDFVLKMSRVFHQLRLEERGEETVLATDAGKVRVALRDILYIESDRHHLIYHMTDGSSHTVYGRMNDAERQYEAAHFVRCNSCYLVNLRYVRRVKGYVVYLDGAELQISQPRKKEFLQKFLVYTEERTR